MNGLCANSESLRPLSPFDRYRSLNDEPLSTRREVMLGTVGRANASELIASDGVVGSISYSQLS